MASALDFDLFLHPCHPSPATSFCIPLHLFRCTCVPSLSDAFVGLHFQKCTCRSSGSPLQCMVSLTQASIHATTQPGGWQFGMQWGWQVTGNGTAMQHMVNTYNGPLHSTSLHNDKGVLWCTIFGGLFNPLPIQLWAIHGSGPVGSSA